MSGLQLKVLDTETGWSAWMNMTECDADNLRFCEPIEITQLPENPTYTVRVTSVTGNIDVEVLSGNVSLDIKIFN